MFYDAVLYCSGVGDVIVGDIVSYLIYSFKNHYSLFVGLLKLKFEVSPWFLCSWHAASSFR